MNGDEETLLQTLEASCHLASDAAIEQFSTTAQQLPKTYSVESLRRMLHCLRAVDAGEVQYELIDAIERFPLDVYVPTLLEELATVRTQAPDWFWLLFQTVLNTDETLAELLACAPALSTAQKSALAEAMRDLVVLDDRYRETQARVEEALA